MDPKCQEMIALGASVSANCVSCVRYHLGKAREVGLSEQQITDALEIGKMVRRGAARKLNEALSQQIKTHPVQRSGSGCDAHTSTQTEKDKAND